MSGLRQALPGWSRARGIDRRLPLALKVIVPVAAVFTLVTVGYALVAVPALQREFERHQAADAHTIASLVQAAYETRADDPTALSAFLQDLVRLNSSISRIRVFTRSAGHVKLWASSDGSEPPTAGPGPRGLDAFATGASAQVIERVDGARVLETIHPFALGDPIEASVAVYVALGPLDDASTATIRLVVPLVAVGTALEAAAVFASLWILVLRPIGVLHGAALRVAAGDLSVDLPQAERPPARDEIARISGEFGRMVRIVAERAVEADRLAATDGLTGLLNRRSFDQRLQQEIDRSRRLGYPLVLSLVDLDGFKSLNDTQGHLAGDDALRRVAHALAAAVRGSDVLARYGGDEFAIIQPGADLQAAAAFGARVRAAVYHLAISVEPRSGRLLNASVGVARLRAGGGTNGALADADAALYRAKARGGGVEVAAERVEQADGSGSQLR